MSGPSRSVRRARGVLGSASSRVRRWSVCRTANATPLRVEVSRDYLFNVDAIAIRTVQRIAIAVQDPAAAAFLVSADS